MNKRISVLITVSVALAVASMASAQTEGTTGTTNTGTGTPKMMRPIAPRVEKRITNVDQRIAQQKDLMNRASTAGTSTRLQNMQEKRADRIEKLTDKRKEIIRNFAARMFHRMEAAIERLKKLDERIGSRITKLKEKGIDTSKAEIALGTAKTEIGNAETHLAAAKTAAQGAIDSETPKEAFESVRTHVEMTRDAIKKAHKALIDAVVALKGKSGNKGGAATTTATTTTN